VYLDRYCNDVSVNATCQRSRVVAVAVAFPANLESRMSIQLILGTSPRRLDPCTHRDRLADLSDEASLQSGAREYS